MKKLNNELQNLIDRNEPSIYQNDCLKALEKGSKLDKEIAIENYKKWINS